MEEVKIQKLVYDTMVKDLGRLTVKVKTLEKEIVNLEEKLTKQKLASNEYITALGDLKSKIEKCQEMKKKLDICKNK